jgi:hypothetical protein
VVNPMLGAVGSTPTNYVSLTADTVKAALFNNTGTPDRTVAASSSGYNTGQWVTANEVTGSSQWVAGGVALSSAAINAASGVVTYSASNITGTATVTMSGIYGVLVYDSTITGGTVAKQGICFNYFGGAQQVTSGTFSINWNASGIFTFTV